jgi:hypothetical protein
MRNVLLRKTARETKIQLETLRSERNNFLIENEASRYRLNTGFSRTDQVFRTKFDEMTELMEKRLFINVKNRTTNHPMGISMT